MTASKSSKSVSFDQLLASTESKVPTALVLSKRDGVVSTHTAEVLGANGVYTQTLRNTALRNGTQFADIQALAIVHKGKVIATATYADKTISIRYADEKTAVTRNRTFNKGDHKRNVRTDYQLTVRDILSHAGLIKRDETSKRTPKPEPKPAPKPKAKRTAKPKPAPAPAPTE